MLRLTEIPLTMPEHTRIHPAMGSIFHGALMSIIAPASAEMYHHMTLRPYSQAVYWDKTKHRALWRIGTLTDEAYERLVVPLEKVPVLWLKQKQYEVTLESMQLIRQTSFEELSSLFVKADSAPAGAEWQCLSVMSFKQDGRYVILPDIRLIYQSLLQRWNVFSDTVKLEQDDLLEQLASHCRLTKYQLRSQVFSVNGSSIYGCEGCQRYSFFGYDMLKRLQGILAAFAPFSGIGVKTALGMGAVDTTIL
ncbi:MAG: CRISPR system precrRNA processing endoribonuclease RAMP protein Cas6 [Megasphaera sp.]|uniref:CRISPR system precrRNA processing endoribonuclease RAMP protein Cas6 n=1 Tax=Megasphaera sp. TaxID=2023260 RepID=UPI003F09EBA0